MWKLCWRHGIFVWTVITLMVFSYYYWCSSLYFCISCPLHQNRACVNRSYYTSSVVQSFEKPQCQNGSLSAVTDGLKSEEPHCDNGPLTQINKKKNVKLVLLLVFQGVGRFMKCFGATPSAAPPCQCSWWCACRRVFRTCCCWCQRARASTWAGGSNAWRPRAATRERAVATTAGQPSSAGRCSLGMRVQHNLPKKKKRNEELE